MVIIMISIVINIVVYVIIDIFVWIINATIIIRSKTWITTFLIISRAEIRMIIIIVSINQSINNFLQTNTQFRINTFASYTLADFLF
jgi:hypothetical protein